MIRLHHKKSLPPRHIPAEKLKWVLGSGMLQQRAARLGLPLPEFQRGTLGPALWAGFALICQKGMRFWFSAKRGDVLLNFVDWVFYKDCATGPLNACQVPLFLNTLFCYFIEAKPGIYLPPIRHLAESCASSPFAKGTLVQIPGCCAALL